MPTLTVKPSRPRIAFLIWFAVASGSGYSRSVPDISRKHSSMEYFSTTGAYSRQMSINAFEERSYRRKSGLASTSSGHLRSAIAIGSPVCTPRAFAGMDFARTTPVRFSRSPPTAAGIRRRSSPPSDTRRADSHDRYALFTSIWKTSLRIRRTPFPFQYTAWRGFLQVGNACCSVGMQLGFFVLGDGLAEVLARLNFAAPQNRGILNRRTLHTGW